jgi:hypothetical protein
MFCENQITPLPTQPRFDHKNAYTSHLGSTCQRNGEELVPFARDDVIRFVQECVRGVVPFQFFGSRPNFDIFCDVAMPMFFGQKFDQLTMASIMGSMDASSMQDGTTMSKERAGCYGVSYVFSTGKPTTWKRVAVS